MGQLKDKMERDLRLRGLSERTISAYLRVGKDFARFHMKDPGEMGVEEIKQYLLHMINVKKLSGSSVQIAYAGLNFLFSVTMGKEFVTERIPYMKKRKRMPLVISREAVQKLLNAARTEKYRNILQVMYSAGLRVSEVAKLKAKDIDSSRMLIRIEFGKGGKSRYAPLAKQALVDLRKYWQQYKPTSWLFAGRKGNHISTRMIQRELKAARNRAGIKQDISTHSLRHSFAVHLLEGGSDIMEVRDLLGHSNLGTTLQYLRARSSDRFRSPLD